MGRELKRVPLDFDWPLKKIWEGFLNPYYKYHLNCPDCEVSGYAPWAKQLQDEWYGYHKEDWVWVVPGERRYNKAALKYNFTEKDLLPMMKGGAFRDLLGWTIYDEDTDTWWEWQGEGDYRKKVTVPQPELPSLKEAIDFMIHAPITGSAGLHGLIEGRANGRGWECPTCKGKGQVWLKEEYEAMADAWEETPIPEGEGYQLWETTSEGSPVSPVFETLDDLCAWCGDNATTFGSTKVSKEEWKKMLEDDFVYHKKGNMVFL